MRAFGFLLSRRWLVFGAVVVVLGLLAWQLGQWQFSRLDERRDRNTIVAANEGSDPKPVDDVLAPGEPVAESEEWLPVAATGTYAAQDTVIVRYRTRDGLAGVNVVVPLETENGTTLLVDRGWLRTSNKGTASVDDLPEPPAGQVEVTGYVRADGTGPATAVDDASTRATSSETIGPAIDREVYRGWVALRSETPGPATTLEPVELPDLDDGPHFFYGLQWWFFGLLAVGGFGYLAWDEKRHGARGQRGGRSVSKKVTATETSRRQRESSPR